MYPGFDPHEGVPAFLDMIVYHATQVARVAATHKRNAESAAEATALFPDESPSAVLWKASAFALACEQEGRTDTATAPPLVRATVDQARETVDAWRKSTDPWNRELANSMPASELLAAASRYAKELETAAAGR